MLASALAEVGRVDEAAERLDRLMRAVEDGFDYMYGAPVAVRYVSELCRRLGDTDRSATLLPHVEAWSGILLVVNTSIEGAADRSVGHLLSTVGRYDEADIAYIAAAELERSAGFPPLAARTEYWHARALLERHNTNDGDRATALLDKVVETTSQLEMTLLHRQALELRAEPLTRP